MKLSLEWIKDYVDLPVDLPTEQIAHDLTMATVEVEGVTRLGRDLEHIEVGRVVSLEVHPDADKLRVAVCDLGGDPQRVVCGGSNLYDGMLVAVAKPGASVRWHGEGEPVRIGRTRVRGVESFGMICAASEIGLSDIFPVDDERAILDLSEFPAQPGQPVALVLGLDDDILEIDNKSLTNRPDLWGHYGIARELAALYELDLKPLPEAAVPAGVDGFPVDIQAPDLCPRYAAAKVSGVRATRSPYWLRSRLGRIGQRPINLPVDLTNYVMFAVGQPSHAFDAREVASGIQVRRARAEERIELLDGSDLELDERTLVIADAARPVALAGVMGGAHASVSDDMREMVLEVANFAPLQIRRTSSRFGARTESSTRFEKGLDPTLVRQAMDLLLVLLRQEQPEVRVIAYTDAYPAPLEPVRIQVSVDFLQRRLGKALPVDRIRESLERLGFTVGVDDGRLDLAVPSWRSTGDVSLHEDIVEEVARLHGYGRFEFVPPLVRLEGAVNQPRVSLERGLKEYLAYRCAMREIVSYPWVEDRYLAAARMDDAATLTLHSPPAPDARRLQPSLIPNLLRAVASNLRYFPSHRLFELNRVYPSGDPVSPNDPAERLPAQPKRLAGALVGQDPEALFLEAKGVVEGMNRVLKMDAISFADGPQAGWADEYALLGLVAGGRPVGVLGAVCARTLRLADIARAHVVLFELDVDRLEAHSSRENRFESLPEFPTVDYDLSLLFSEGVRWADIHEASAQAHELLRKVEFIDEYRGQQVPEGRKSLTMRLLLGSASGTLTSDQIDEVAARVVAVLSHRFGAEMRDV